MKNNYLRLKNSISLELFLSKKYILLLITLLLFSSNSLFAQIAGPNNAGTGTNVNTTGTISWTNTGNITAADGTSATAAITTNATTNYIQGTSYGFSIPTGAIINGIEVIINRKTSANNGGRITKDNIVRVIKNGTIITATNYATATSWPTTFATATYGSSTDLWGTTWTPADINATNFGAVLSVTANNSLTASVDYIQIKVYYTTISFSPSNACIGSNAAVIITGNNLIGTSTVSFNGTLATFVQNSNTQVTATLPFGATTGTISITTPSGTGTSSSNFTVNPLPTIAAISGATDVCIGSTITLSNATSGGIWSSSNASKATINSSGLVTGIASGNSTITYTYTNGNGCTNSVSKIITINTLPIVSAPSSVCIGSTIQLSPNTGGTWISNDITKASVDNTGLVTGISIGSVSFTFTDNITNCSKTTNTVNVFDAPSITIQPITIQTICSGSSVIFSVNAIGGGLSYQWYKGISALSNGGSISGANSATLTISPVSSTDGNPNYYCIVSGSCLPSITSNDAELIVIEKVTITSQPIASQTFCTGETATFSVVASGAGLTYQWYKGITALIDNASISGATTDTLTLSTLSTGDASNNYYCLVSGTSPCSAIASSYSILNINQSAIINSQPIATQTVCENSSVSLTVSATGVNLSYQWFKGGLPLSNGGNISGATTATLTINPVLTSNAASDYYCVISNGCNPNTSSNNSSIVVNATTIGGFVTITHTANSSGIMVALPSPSNTYSDCHLSSGIIALNGQTGTVIRWESSSNAGNTWVNLGNAGNTTYSYTSLTVTTIFRAVIQNANCSIAFSANATLFIIPNIKPTPISASPSTICVGQSTTLTSQSGFSSSQNIQYGGLFNTANPAGWRVDGNGVFSASGDNGNPTTFKETNGNASSEYNSTSDDKFAIARGNVNTTLETPVFDLFGLSSASLTFDHAYKLSAGAWGKVELSFDGGSSYPVTLATYSGNQSPYNQFNTGISLNLNPYLGYTNLRIRFNFHGLIAKTTGIDGDAWVIDNVNIPQAPVPTLTSLWTDITSSAVISVTNTTNTSVSPIITTTYAVTSFLNGCTSYGPDGTTYITVTVNQLPIVTASPATICSGDQSNIALSSAVIGTQTSTTFAWSVVQTDATGASAGSGSFINQTLTTTGTNQGTVVYSITPTANGCVGVVKNITAFVNPRPKANIGPSQTICFGGTASFSVSLEGIGPWNLTYSNGTSSTTINNINTNPYLFSVSGITTNSTYTLTSLSDSRCTAKPQDLTGVAVVTVLNGTPGLWTGLVSTDWFDCKNWAGGLPSNTIDAQIPTTTVGGRMPVIDRTSPFAASYSFIASARDLLIATSATVTMVATNNSELQISRDWKNSGSFIPGTGTVTFKGATFNQIQNINVGIKTNETFYNLTTNNSNGAKGISVVDNFELTVINNLSLLSGDLRLTGEAQLVQNGTTANPSSGTGIILKDQQGNKSSFHYNYWSSPVTTNGTNYSIGSVLRDGTDSATNPFNPSTINFGGGYYFADGALTFPIKISSSWLYKFTSVSTTYAGWQFAGDTGTINPGEGFTMKGPTGIAPFTTTQNYVFAGKPNNGNITLSIALNQSYLAGNPYPSALDADEFIKDNIKDGAGRAASNIFNGALYFWDHFGGQGHILSQYIGGYSTYTLMGGVVAISNDPLINANGSQGTRNPKKYIPVGQGFFIGTGSNGALTSNNPNLSSPITGGIISFKNSQRAFKAKSATQSIFFRNANQNQSTTEESDNRQKIRLQFVSPSNMFRQILVGADENTTNLYDIGYDAFVSDLNAEDLFWENSNTKLVIQAVPDFNQNQILPIGIKTNSEGLTTIKIAGLENISDNTQLYIHDELTGIDHNIRISDFTISLPIGEYNGRFSLRFSSNTLGTNIPNENNPIIYFTNTDSSLNIKNTNAEYTIKSVKLFNLLGQFIADFKVEESNQENIRIPINNIASGTYIVKIMTDTNLSFSQKIIKN